MNLDHRNTADINIRFRSTNEGMSFWISGQGCNGSIKKCEGHWLKDRVKKNPQIVNRKNFNVSSTLIWKVVCK